MFLGWLVAAAVAADSADAPTSQRIRELEWSRSAVVQLASQVPGADAPTRAEAMRALGRLRNADALETLVSAKEDPDESVRLAAAEALGWTPGSTAAIRAWLAEQPLPASPAERARAEHGVSTALLLDLGFQGGPDEVPLLEGYLDEPWPIGATAARALGRMGIRKVDGVEGAVGALCGRLHAPDPRTVDDVAWALSRVGLARAAPADVAKVEQELRTTRTYETARARLVKAVWPQLDAAHRDGLFLRLATDPSRLVRVALLDAVAKEDVSADVLSAWLVDPDPWIRWAAIGALGREGSETAHDALQRHARETTDPWEQAEAIRALHEPDPSAAADQGLPAAVRAAEVESLDDPAAWEKLALDDPEKMVRTAAVGSLVDAEATRADVGVRLLAAQDEKVREAAIELVERGDAKSRVAALVPHLRVESDPEVLAAGLKALADAGGPYPPEIDALLNRVSGRSEQLTRSAAASLARAAGRPEPPPPPAPEGERELVLPGGAVVQVEQGRPAIASVARIRRARVQTSEGAFVIALDPDVAPLAVANFARLAEAGFFDGLVFHRVVPGFVVQTGCPRGDGWGGPGYVIPDEVSGVDYDTGSVGMARSDRDTGGSQWFVTTSPQPHLTGEYTRFGHVVEGMDVVKRLHRGSELLGVTIDRIELPATPTGGPGG